MEYPSASDLVQSIHVDRGTAVSTANHYPLIAGRGKNGVCYYVARIYVYDGDCYPECECIDVVHVAVTEGMKLPEDLCVDVECPHTRRLFVPHLGIVTSLYPPNESPITFVDDDDTPARLTLSWTSAGRHKKQCQQYSVKLTTVAEVVERRIFSDVLDAAWEREAYAICELYRDSRLPILVEVARYIDR